MRNFFPQNPSTQRNTNDSNIVKCNFTLNPHPPSVNQTMRNISIRLAGYDISIILFILIGTLLGTAAAATYIWTTKTIDIQIEEPLTITSFPTSIRTHPGQNQTLDITIENTATVTYTVTLTFTLENATYQTQYVTFSNNTYTINPGTNQITAWMTTNPAAPNINLQLTIQFHRQ